MTHYYYITINGKTVDGKKYKTQLEAENASWIAATSSNNAVIEICKVIAICRLTIPRTFYMNGEQPAQEE